MSETKFVIAYLVSLDLKSSAQNTLEKSQDKELGSLNVRNFHRQVHAALAGLREIQNGIKMQVRLCNQVKKVRLILPILAIPGDGQQSDQNCGRIEHIQLSQSERKHWACNCPAMETANPLYACTWNKVDEFKHFSNVALGKCHDAELSQEQAIKSLRQYDMYPADLAFYHTLNACPTHGPFCMCTVCLMHAFDEGMAKYCLGLTFEAFGPTGRAAADRLLRQIFKKTRQTQMSQYPTTDFTRGVSNLSHLKAKEWNGLLFHMAVFLCLGVG